MCWTHFDLHWRLAIKINLRKFDDRNYKVFKNKMKFAKFGTRQLAVKASMLEGIFSRKVLLYVKIMSFLVSYYKNY